MFSFDSLHAIRGINCLIYIVFFVQASIVTVELKIPQKIHTSLIGSKGRLIKSVMDECGDVHIHFPAEGTNSDVVVIRGVKEDVEKAKKQLLEMASDSEKQLAEKQLSSFTAEVHAKPEYHRYLIGRGGANISKVFAIFL